MQIQLVVKVVAVRPHSLPADGARSRKAAITFFHRGGTSYAKLYSTTNFSQLKPGAHPGSGPQPL